METNGVCCCCLNRSDSSLISLFTNLNDFVSILGIHKPKKNNTCLVSLSLKLFNPPVILLCLSDHEIAQSRQRPLLKDSLRQNLILGEEQFH